MYIYIYIYIYIQYSKTSILKLFHFCQTTVILEFYKTLLKWLFIFRFSTFEHLLPRFDL